ncbi:hypothetical protein CV102_10500 [Natronococcus pandeyae]|uniref:Uncharacterized protein n=1 Tax=Natronococcus pandeyae TaxID=2055836 RepID=A0A8J8Q865_9EURY|nr:hypothetical protein [Natronococcus pandeyae]TYL38925.1 hypothetical protein CV102_10500 [Natronococcus pandeyae]
MSDRSTDSSVPDSSASADGADSGDDLEPGGGPQRVVSDQSVDDILDSLDDSGPNSSSSITTIESEANDADEREREPARADATTETENEAETNDSASETTTDDLEDENSAAETAAADEASGSTADTDGQGGESDTDKRGGESDTETGSSSAVDDAAASLSSEASAESLEDLEARVERGTVTGADVRAAEAGDDRDATPEIDEIELSVDDLETPESTIGDGPSDAGPLAGSIGSGGDGDDETDNTVETNDDKSGLIDRLVGLFSR